MLTGSGPLYQPPLSEDQRNGQIEVMHRFTITAWGKMAAVPEPERWIAIADGTIAPPSYLITQNRGVWCSAWSGPPCWELLNNPVAVMTHPDRWPMHLCHDVLKE